MRKGSAAFCDHRIFRHRYHIVKISVFDCQKSSHNLGGAGWIETTESILSKNYVLVRKIKDCRRFGIYHRVIPAFICRDDTKIRRKAFGSPPCIQTFKSGCPLTPLLWLLQITVCASGYPGGGNTGRQNQKKFFHVHVYSLPILTEYFAPFHVTAVKRLDQQLGSGKIRGQRNIVSVAKTHNIVYIRLMILGI